jgi:hypothetical protein
MSVLSQKICVLIVPVCRKEAMRDGSS